MGDMQTVSVGAGLARRKAQDAQAIAQWCTDHGCDIQSLLEVDVDDDLALAALAGGEYAEAAARLAEEAVAVAEIAAQADDDGLPVSNDGQDDNDPGHTDGDPAATDNTA